MKKASIVIAICLFIAMVLSSCSGSKKCPAYTQNNQNNIEASVC